MASIWSQLGQHIIRGKGPFLKPYIVVKVVTEEELIKFLCITFTFLSTFYLSISLVIPYMVFNIHVHYLQQ